MGDIKWRSYPVLYHIDASGVSGICSSAAKSAVVAGFYEIDREEHPSGRFFLEAGGSSDADIYVRWGYLDGTGKSFDKRHFGTMLEQTLLLMQKLYLTAASDGVLFLAQAVLIEQEVHLTSKT